MKYWYFYILAIIFGLGQLSGCTIPKNKTSFASKDGPPDIDLDWSKVKNAIPKAEPYHSFGTRSYYLKGKYYKVLKNSKGYIKKGYASWYGSKFHGRQTSTQERFNLYSMTAASPELPLPTYVEVTNLRNGKTVVVKVNDRGPFCYNRILDLSYAAAKKLDFVREGTAPVRIVAIDPKTWKMDQKLRKNIKVASPERKTSDNYAEKKNRTIFLQLGAFKEANNARKFADRLKEITNYGVIIANKFNMYVVQVGPVLDMQEANRLEEFLKSKGLGNILFIR